MELLAAGSLDKNKVIVTEKPHPGLPIKKASLFIQKRTHRKPAGLTSTQRVTEISCILSIETLLAMLILTKRYPLIFFNNYAYNPIIRRFHALRFTFASVPFFHINRQG